MGVDEGDEGICKAEEHANFGEDSGDVITKETKTDGEEWSIENGERGTRMGKLSC